MKFSKEARAALDKAKVRPTDSQEVAEAKVVEGNPMLDILRLLNATTRHTKHPGSKKGYQHASTGHGNVWRAVTRPRRQSENHLRKFPGPLWMRHR